MKHQKIYFVLVAFLFLMVHQLKATQIKLVVNNQTELTATLVDNSSTAALIEILKVRPLTIAMQDYGSMEKVGSIGSNLPTNDEQIATAPGDLILYQGNALVIYYAPNSWNFTRLGKIDNKTQAELRSILGTGSISVTISLLNTSGIYDAHSTDRIKIFQDLTSNVISIEGEINKVTLIDLGGSIIRQTKERIVDISNINSGVYILNITLSNNKTERRKIIKI